MKIPIGLFTAGLLCVGVQGASLVNGSFEDGLNGWTTTGSVEALPNIGGNNPTDGLAFAMLVGNSTLTQTFTLPFDAVLAWDALFVPSAPEWRGEISVTGGVGGSVYQPNQGWVPPDNGWSMRQVTGLMAGEWTIAISLESADPQARMGIDNFRFFSPIGWFDYGPDGFMSSTPYPGTHSEVPIESVPEPASVLAVLASALVFGLLRHSAK